MSRRRGPHRLATAGLAACVCVATAVVATPASRTSGAAATVVDDGFARTVAGGWGSAPVGGSYSLNLASTFSTDGSVGRVTIGRGEDRRAMLGVTLGELDASLRLRFDSIPATGSGAYAALSLRSAANGNEYRARIRALPGGVGRISLVRVVGSTQAVTAIGPEVQLPFPVTAGGWYRMRATVTGTTDVTLRLKVWPDAAAEPGWQLSGADPSAARLTNAGRLGLWFYISSSGSSTQIAIDDLAATEPTPPLPPTTTTTTTTTVAATTTTAPATTSTTVAATTTTTLPATTTTTPLTTTTLPAATTTTVAATTTTTAPATTTTTSTVAPPPTDGPRADFAFGAADLRVEFDASASTGDGLTFDWDFGNWTSGSGVRTSFTYATPGTRGVRLTVTDRFGRSSTVVKQVTAAVAGASLPLRYTFDPAAADQLVVATWGSDSNPGTITEPLATVAHAISRVSPGRRTTIVVRGGLYREGNLRIPSNKQVRIVGFPYEVPVFNGATPVTQWTPSGSLVSAPYQPQPVTDGSGIPFSTGTLGLNPPYVGRFPDQVWVGDAMLRQVLNRSEVRNGTFWVDRTAQRVFVTAADAQSATVEVSALDQFIRISGAGSSLEGLRIMRFSNSADDYGVIFVDPSGHGTTMRHIEVLDAAFQAIQFSGDEDSKIIVRGATLEHVTIDRPNWMGVSATLVDDLTMRWMRITRNDPHDEFYRLPQSGALKTSRTRNVVVADSLIADNNGDGLWFDQSSANVTIIGNRIVGNTGWGVFFELSDGLLMADNYVRSQGGGRALIVAGAGGAKIVNNTLVGGTEPMGAFPDNRSKPGCADPAQPLCANSYPSDRDTVRPLPPTLDWMPRVDLMLNNIIAHPTQNGYCGAVVAMCVTEWNLEALRPIQTIFHQAEPARGIPRTVVDGNVYVSSTGMLFGTPIGDFPTLAAFVEAMRRPPVSLDIEQRGRSGPGLVNADGTPTTALADAHGTAVPVPNAGALDRLPPGTTRFGSLRAPG